MAKHNIFVFSFACLVFSCIILLSGAATQSGNEYIVYMGSLPKEASFSPTSQHLTMLQQVFEGGNIENLLLRSYKRSFNGFTAILNDQQREKLVNMKGVVSVFPNQNYHLTTTGSWNFLGFPQTIKRDPIIESDVIIGVIDSGITPESQSFNDKGI